LAFQPRYEDLGNERWKSRLGSPAPRVFGDERAQLAVLGSRPRRKTKILEHARDFSIEVGRDSIGRTARRGAHPVLFRLTDLADPPVLERREANQQENQNSRRRE